jgi:hypothetical protein
VGLAPTAPVTAQRVRDGEPAALAALVDRRGGAVLAYCEEVAAPGHAAAAAGDAFARFRREVVAAEEPRLLDPEALLLRSARQASAAVAVRTVAPRGLLARRLGATCVLVPELLAARAEGTLTTADRLRLSRHLERCAGCREAEERFVAGERAYRDAPSEPPPPKVAEPLLAALRDAAPNSEREGAASAEGNGAVPAPVVLDEAPEGEEPVIDQPTLSWDAADVAAGAAAAEGNGAVPAPVVLDEAPEGEEPVIDQPTLSWDAADVAAGAAASRSERRGWSWYATRLVIPAVVFAAAFVVALAVAGVFGDDPAGSIQTQSADPPAQIRVHARPVTTPLPENVTGAAAAPAPHDETAAARPVTTFAAASSQAAPAPAAPESDKQQLSAQTRRRSEAAAPPPEQSAPATTDQTFTQPPPAP